MSLLRCALVIVCLTGCAATRAAVPQEPPRRPPQPRGPAPSLKKVEKPAAPQPSVRRTYDRAHKLTYLDVSIPLGAAGESSPASPAAASGPKLVFRLAYRGQTSNELAAAFLLVASPVRPGEAARLDGVKQVEVNAEGYQYLYDRVDYRASVAPSETGDGATGDAAALPTEVATFALVTEELPRIANANRIDLKLGAEVYSVGAVRLTELRRALVLGAGS